MFSSYSFHQEFKFLNSKNKSGRLTGEIEQSKTLGKQFWEQPTCWPHVNCHLGEGTKWGHHLWPPSYPSHLLHQKNKTDIKQKEIGTACHIRRERKRAGEKQEGDERYSIQGPKQKPHFPGEEGSGQPHLQHVGPPGSFSEPAFGESVMLSFQ